MGCGALTRCFAPIHPAAPSPHERTDMPSSPLLGAVLCMVVGVTDGDTVTVRCRDQPQEKVRLSQIDAPERSQAFGHRAKEALSDLVYGKEVELQPLKLDRYGRTVGALSINGRNVEWQLVEGGWAWCYEKYLTDLSCRGLQTSAQRARRGLWVDPQPIPPWEYRRSKR